MRVFNIKGITFGEGRPVICIPVVKNKKIIDTNMFFC